MPLNIHRTKIVILGDSAVGKTALTQMFVSDGTNFPKNYNMTISVDVHQKQIIIPSTDHAVEFLIFDSSGSDYFREALPKCWTESSLLAIVYDVTQQESFESVPDWLDTALSSQWASSSSHRPLAQALIANKIDLTARRFVTEEIGRKMADKYDFQYFETSAKENQGIEDVFIRFAKECLTNSNVGSPKRI
ncbi:intraflagellar transport protein 27 homolog isoform X1 [Nilaparvata lugens]|uniref:intraflagellar transport protein 27 homolog isoform X1 n=1 Tax=Nilaparvata lugens TaxID=108931 RepID=UPI00193E79A1|nr:intraflagellar transport protein 27 homolog isoform X1 [Nilaparvata lugens]